MAGTRGIYISANRRQEVEQQDRSLESTTDHPGQAVRQAGKNPLRLRLG